jgi:hypothetical protein
MTTTHDYAAEIAAATARLAAATAEVDDLRAKLAAEHAASKNAQQDDEPTGRAVTAEDGREAARRRFAKDADDAPDTAQDSAAAGAAEARRRFGRQ